MTSAVDHLLALIRIPSVSSVSNLPVVEYATSVLTNAGWQTAAQVHVDSNGTEKLNLIAAPPGQDPAKEGVDLAFVCHTDTVPYAADWVEATQPFVAEETVYGCGACDVKGFLACLLTAAESVDASAIAPATRILLTADEEVGCLGAHRLLDSARVQPRRMVIGEPTQLQPARAGKGYCLAEVTVFGAAAHSAHPQQGRSAIFDAARLLREIEVLATRLAAQQNAFFTPPFTTLNVGTMEGGSAKNVIPAECRFLLEWRPIPGNLALSVPAAVADVAEQLRRDDPGFRCEIKILRQQPGFETPASTVLVRRMESLTGKPAISIPFGSEASVFASVAEEIVVWGPGDMRTAHSPRECVPVAELHQAVACIRTLLQTQSGRVALQA